MMNTEEIGLIYVLTHSEWRYVGKKECTPYYDGRNPYDIKVNDLGGYDFYFLKLLRPEYIVKDVHLIDDFQKLTYKNIYIVTDYTSRTERGRNIVLCNIDDNNNEQQWDINKINNV